MNELKKDDLEFQAMRAIYDTLQPLDNEARGRVIRYINERLDIVPPPPLKVVSGNNSSKKDLEPIEKNPYDSCAELFDAAKQPNTQADRVLVAAYFLQIVSEESSFEGFGVNKLLKQLGHGIGHITTPLDTLKKRSPALVLQLSKTGKGKQSRKTYKLTTAGIKAVEDMING